MTATADVPGSTARYPTRFREAEERSRRLGRPLRIFGRIDDSGVDEGLMDRIGRGFFETDRLGAGLAEAMRMRAGAPGRVRMDEFRAALAGGVAAVPDPAPALVEFFEEVERVPAWVDWGLVDEGAAVFRRLGQNAADVLLQLALIGGYRFGGPIDLLVATGGLTGDMTRRRLAETQKWGDSLADPGALRPPRDGRPGGEGWRLTVHVRAMHALVNAGFAEQWDTERWGLPINMSDQASTLGLFDGVLIIGCRALGVPVDGRDSRALMHLWKYVGWLMGVHEDFLVDDEWERHRISYHVLLAQAGMSDAGPQLTQAIVAAQGRRAFPRWPAALLPWRRRFETERLLSMLTVFLGPESMREFGLPLRPPWAHLYIGVLNTVRYRLVARLPGGERRLRAWGKRRGREVVESYFAGEAEGLGELRGGR
ncbi:oxygenase MpaB family protein [Nocardioides sambongensis]|uniref:oxygenase MpaB family protein n=1 Tax=Nocardioides sambongensis TaxID=2589074 RepID=UPI0011267033|nr:oxygenase MpaB family protein [Nocardioides sambongensis]